MKRTEINRLLTYSTLKQYYFGSEIVEYATEYAYEYGWPHRQLCAMVSERLAQRVDHITAVLDIRKRQLIEAALISALAEAEQVIQAEGMDHLFSQFDEHEEQGEDGGNGGEAR